MIPYDDLDPGIRDAVRLLAYRGFQPTDSGDGVSKVGDPDALPYPHVFCMVDPERMLVEAQRAWLLPWAVSGLVKPTVEVSYNPEDGKAVLMLSWNPS